MYRGVGLTRSYGGVRALRGVDVAFRAGEVHALLGANGAGKSTLLRLLAGAEAPDGGSLELAGSPVTFGTTQDAVDGGVATVFQELSLFPELDVLANLFALREPRRFGLVDRRAMRRLAEPVLRQVGLDVDLEIAVGRLSLGEQQLVEIARALLQEPKILLLDEPTSALQAGETARLMSVIDLLRSTGVAIVYVSHFLEEVMGIADVATVLRDGDVVLASVPMADLSVEQIVGAMIGDAVEPKSVGGRESTNGHREPVLSVEGLEVRGPGARIDLVAHTGEILGLCGLEGAGQQAVLETLFGLRRGQAERIRLPDGLGAPSSPSRAVRRGVAFIPSDRKAAGGAMEQSIRDNVAIVSAGSLGRLGPFPSRTRMHERATRGMDALGVKAPSCDTRLGALSGGNQQKVIFAKWLETDPALVLLDDPTRGVDVATKAEMHGLIRELSEAGRVVVLTSSDTAELLQVCDRIVVICDGRSTVELDPAMSTEHDLLRAANTSA